MRCKYCGKRIREGERCSCRNQRSGQTAGRQMQNPYQTRNKRAAMKAAKRRRRKRRIRRFFLTVLLLILLGVLGLFGYQWFEQNKDTVLSMLPFMQKTEQSGGAEATALLAENVGETTAWTDSPVEKEDHADEIARIKEQYQAGRIDYGGVMKNLSRLDMVTMSEVDQVSYQNLAAQAAQDLRDTVSSYIDNGYYSEASALLSRLNQTIPGDTVVAELISLYASQIGM